MKTALPNVYTSNYKTSKYMKQKLIGQIVEDLNNFKGFE